MPAESRPESLGQSLERLFGHAEYQRFILLGQQAPPEDVELVCPRCKDAGWLRLNLPAQAADFGKIVECPCGMVAARRTDRLFGRSRIPAEYADLGLETYPDQRIASALRDWLRGGERPWLLIVGAVGVGKTGLAIGVIKLAVAEGRPALFRPTVELLSDIRATYRTREGTEPHEAELVRAVKEVEVLALDDVGAERATGWAADRLYEILNHRYNERRRTILTTNLEPDEIEEHLGERVLSRIVGMSERYEIIGPNLRLRAAREV